MESKDALIIVHVFSLFFCAAPGNRVRNKMYIELKVKNACIKNLDAKGEVGCTSEASGNVGTIHFLATQDDYDVVLKTGLNYPYVAVLNSVDCNGSAMAILKEADRINGIMLLGDLNLTDVRTYPQAGFSSVDICPNSDFGIYKRYNEKKRHEMEWNPPGTGLRFTDIGKPVFLVTDPEDINSVVIKCFQAFNVDGKANCAAEMRSYMVAAKDAITCMRRSRPKFSLSGSRGFCDPLGDMNVVVTLKNLYSSKPRANESVILMAARLDATSLFKDTHYAADTTVVGFVALLAAVEAVWRVRDAIRVKTDSKDILIAFFQGETFDYIGSSRMVYDMKMKKFPQDFETNDNSLLISHIGLEHLSQIVELNQVGHRQDAETLWMHKDRDLTGHTSNMTNHMLEDLTLAGKDCGVSFKPSDDFYPLPPSSVHTFLNSKRDIPALVITDHHASYLNQFYNSRFDTGLDIGAINYPANLSQANRYNHVTRQAELVTNLSRSLALYLYKNSMGVLPDKASDAYVDLTSVNTSLVTNLLYCFLVSPNCELFKESVDAEYAKYLETLDQPLSYYVGTNTELNEVTFLVKSLLVRFTGSLVQAEAKECQGRSNRYDKFVWMQGRKQGEDRQGWCYQHHVMYTPAVSPAFVIKDYDMTSGNFSTWTESRWNSEFGVRLFLLSSKEFQLLNLTVGVVFFLLSILAVQLCVDRVDIIFKNSTQHIEHSGYKLKKRVSLKAGDSALSDDQPSESSSNSSEDHRSGQDKSS